MSDDHRSMCFTMSSAPTVGTSAAAHEEDSLDNPEWKRKFAVAREQVIYCAEGKLTSMFVKYAADAGLNVFDQQARTAFILGWAKEKGLLVSVCWEAFNELRQYMPVVSMVKVCGSADSVVSVITTKYTQHSKYRDRKGADNARAKTISATAEGPQPGEVAPTTAAGT